MSEHHRSTATGLYRYFARLLAPPLSGDGFLLVGFVEGLVGWPLSHLVASDPSLVPFGPFASIVGLWVLLTAILVVVGVFYAAPTVRNNDVWGVSNGVAVGVNVLALTGRLPPGLVQYGFWHP